MEAAQEKKYRDLHETFMYPIVRVRTAKAGGSGTIVYSKPLPGKDEYESYLITNNHVVDSAISQKKQWSGLLQRDVKKDVLEDVTVEQFFFEYGSWMPTTRGFNGEVVAYDKMMDIAIVRIKTVTKFDHVAKMFPKGAEKDGIRMFQAVYAVGAGLGHPPLQTQGQIAGNADKIDNYDYWLSTAPTIFGNSGGAVFLADTGEYIGIPSRLSVVPLGLGGSAITHMSYFIPITGIYDFIDDNMLQFLYDSEFTSDKCREMRKAKRDRDERLSTGDSEREEGSGCVQNPDCDKS